MKKPIDLTNQKFGRLTAIKITECRNKYNVRQWLCKCDCGNDFYTTGSSLRDKNNQSCGCLAIDSNHLKGEKSKTWKGHGELPHAFFTTIKRGADLRGITLRISIKEMWKLFLKQNRKCALTGLDLNFGSRKLNENITASLDRIDSSKGYVKKNIQWVHKDINKMKMNLPESKFLDYCKLVVKHHK